MLFQLLASASIAPTNVPDSGMTGLLLGAGILALGLFARFVKNRKK